MDQSSSPSDGQILDVVCSEQKFFGEDRCRVFFKANGIKAGVKAILMKWKGNEHARFTRTHTHARARTHERTHRCTRTQASRTRESCRCGHQLDLVPS